MHLLVKMDDNELDNRNRILRWRIVHDAARKDRPNGDRITCSILVRDSTRKRRGELTQNELEARLREYKRRIHRTLSRSIQKVMRMFSKPSGCLKF